MTSNKSENPFLGKEINELCIVCNKTVQSQDNYSIFEDLPQSPSIKFYDALKLLSNFLQLNHDTCPQNVCSTCFLNGNMAFTFHIQCNKSAEYITAYKLHQEDNKYWNTKCEAIENNNENNTEDEIIDEQTECIDMQQFLKINISNENKTSGNNSDDDDMHLSNDEEETEDYSVDSSEDSDDSDYSDKKYKQKSKKNKNRTRKKENITKSKKPKEVIKKGPRVECEFCHKTFRHDYIKIHRRIHTGENPYSCDICDKKFRSAVVCRQHIVVKHNDSHPFLCPICGKSFKLQAILKKHSICHEEGTFICEICGKAFRTKFKRKEHYATHSDEKPFLCDECPKGFGTRKHLKQHQVIHAKVKPIQCEFCGRGFTQRHALRSHLVKSCKGKTKTENENDLHNLLV